MRSAEDVARGWIAQFGEPAYSEDVSDLADLMRARDAEVRADERARVLAEFEWETRNHYDEANVLWEDQRRRVGPWESDTRTDEQRSAEAVDELRHRLGGEQP